MLKINIEYLKCITRSTWVITCKFYYQRIVSLILAGRQFLVIFSQMEEEFIVNWNYNRAAAVIEKGFQTMENAI
jgi:hypothetical protein